MSAMHRPHYTQPHEEKAARCNAYVCCLWVLCKPHLHQPAQVLFLDCELLDNFGELLLDAKVVTRTGLS